MSETPTSRLRIVQGDIAKLAVTAIVNAANSSLLGGGGVDGAIHRAGGPQILTECQQMIKNHYPDSLPIGQAVATTASKLAAQYIIHTVGPIWKGRHQHEAELLASCYNRCMERAEALRASSVAFPGISTGIYGYPKAEAAAVAVREVRQWLAAMPSASSIRATPTAPRRFASRAATVAPQLSAASPSATIGQKVPGPSMPGPDGGNSGCTVQKK